MKKKKNTQSMEKYASLCLHDPTGEKQTIQFFSKSTNIRTSSCSDIPGFTEELSCLNAQGSTEKLSRLVWSVGGRLMLYDPLIMLLTLNCQNM